MASYDMLEMSPSWLLVGQAMRMQPRGVVKVGHPSRSPATIGEHDGSLGDLSNANAARSSTTLAQPRSGLDPGAVPTSN